MKKIVMIFAAMAAVLSSCQKSELESVSVNDGKDIVLNISVSNPGAGDTKAPIKSAWADGDVISIWYDTNNSTNPDLVIEYDAANTKWIQKEGATVSGNTPSEGDNKYAKALYNGTVKVASNDNYTFENSTLTFNIANWKFLTEVQVVVKGLTSASAGSYTLACDKFTPLAAGNGYTVESDAITASAGTKGTAVTGIINTDGVAFVFATAEYSSTATAFKFTLTDNTSGSAVTKEYTATTDKISGTTSSMTAIKALTIESSKFAVPAPDGFVDLGVVVNSKPLFWAKCNLGATKPEEYGKYYSWGDVTGQTLSDETFSKPFSWTNDVFGKTFNKGVEQATACPGGVLASTYDVAYQTDNAWRMPTTEDFMELFQQCYAEWGTYNGVDGLIVYKAKSADDKGYAYFNGTVNKYTGSGNNWNPTDKEKFTSYSTASDTFLFFPAAGLGGTAGGSNTLSNAGSGHYWSSSLFYASNTQYAFFLRFSSEIVKPQDANYRYYGRQVRPVSD